VVSTGLRVISADSGGALLNERFEPTHVVCTVAVLVEPPYRAPSALLAEPSFCPIDDSYPLLVKELELCRRMLEQHEADVIHFDMSLRSAKLNELTISALAHLPERVRSKLAKVVPKLTFIASEIWASHGIPVLAIGKESVPVRIAELSCAAHAVLFSARRALEEGKPVLLGLPTSCLVRHSRGTLVVRSLLPAEYDLMGLAHDEEGIMESVRVLDMPNPVARGFRALRIEPLEP